MRVRECPLGKSDRKISVPSSSTNGFSGTLSESFATPFPVQLSEAWEERVGRAGGSERESPKSLRGNHLERSRSSSQVATRYPPLVYQSARFSKEQPRVDPLFGRDCSRLADVHTAQSSHTDARSPDDMSSEAPLTVSNTQRKARKYRHRPRLLSTPSLSSSMRSKAKANLVLFDPSQITARPHTRSMTSTTSLSVLSKV
mmetsp:Transcript_744/g.1233  ORF Transcript_744/g.1233 Transcript_744/m.1233 type:complete len:200 (+) Transcript_744:1715-2314(+)